MKTKNKKLKFYNCELNFNEFINKKFMCTDANHNMVFELKKCNYEDGSSHYILILNDYYFSNVEFIGKISLRSYNYLFNKRYKFTMTYEKICILSKSS